MSISLPIWAQEANSGSQLCQPRVVPQPRGNTGKCAQICCGRMWNCRHCMPTTCSQSHLNCLGFPQRYHKPHFPICAELFQWLSPPLHVQPCQLFSLPWDMVHGQRISVLRKTPSSCCSTVAAVVVQQEVGVKLSSCKRSVASICRFSPTARNQWGARAKERWPSLAWSFTSILLPFQQACTFRSIVKFKCHGIDLSGNKFSQRQSPLKSHNYVRVCLFITMKDGKYSMHHIV